MSVNNMIDFGNVGVSFVGYENVAFTTASQTIYTLNTTLIFAVDGGVINGVGITIGQTGTVTALTSINFGKVVNLLNGIPSTYSNVTSIVGNSVINIGGAGVGNTSPLLTTFTMPNAKYCLSGSFAPFWATLTTLNLPAMKIVATTFSPTVALCTTMSLPALAYVGTTVAISAAVLTTLSLPELVGVGTTFTITAANMETFSIGATLKSIGGNFTMTGMKLNQASVDGILVRLAALDGTNGTTAYSGFTISLNGGTSATPSATGLAAKAILVGRGCTVNNN